MPTRLLPIEGRFAIFDKSPGQDCVVKDEEGFHYRKTSQRTLVPVTELMGVSIRPDPNGAEIGMEPNPIVLTVNRVLYNKETFTCELGGERYRVPGKQEEFTRTRSPGNLPEGYLRDLNETRERNKFYVPKDSSKNDKNAQLRTLSDFMLSKDKDKVGPIRRIKPPEIVYHLPKKGESFIELRRGPALDHLVMDHFLHHGCELPSQIPDLEIAFAPWTGEIEPSGEGYMFTSTKGQEFLANPSPWVRKMLNDIFGVDVGDIKLYRKYGTKTIVGRMHSLWSPFPPKSEPESLRTLGFYHQLEYLSVLSTLREYNDHNSALHYIFDGAYCFRRGETPCVIMDGNIQVVDCSSVNGEDAIKHAFTHVGAGWDIDLRYPPWWRENVYRKANGLVVTKSSRKPSFVGSQQVKAS